MAWSGSYKVSYGEKPISSVKYNNQVDEVFTYLEYLRTTFIGTTAPADPETGQAWYDSANTKIKYYNGATWDALAWDADLTTHISSGGHAATAISITDSGGYFTGSEVEAALQEIGAKFNITTGHDHDGTDSKKVTSANVLVVDSGGYFTGADVEAVLQEVGGKFHTSTGHDHDGSDSKKVTAANVLVVDSGGYMDAADVEAAFQEVYVDMIAYFNTTSGHDHDGTDSKKVTSANVLVVDSGGYFTGADVEAVLQEVGGKFHTSTGHDHDGTDSKKVIAGNVTVTPSGNLSSTDVQAALQELQTDVDSRILKSIGTAKGSVIGFSASGTPAERTVGSNDTVLCADSSETSGLAFKTLSALGAASVADVIAFSIVFAG